MPCGSGVIFFISMLRMKRKEISLPGSLPPLWVKMCNLMVLGGKTDDGHGAFGGGSGSKFRASLGHEWTSYPVEGHYVRESPTDYRIDRMTLTKLHNFNRFRFSVCFVPPRVVEAWNFDNRPTWHFAWCMFGANSAEIHIESIKSIKSIDRPANRIDRWPYAYGHRRCRRRLRQASRKSETTLSTSLPISERAPVTPRTLTSDIAKVT